MGLFEHTTTVALSLCCFKSLFRYRDLLAGGLYLEPVEPYLTLVHQPILDSTICKAKALFLLRREIWKNDYETIFNYDVLVIEKDVCTPSRNRSA